MDRRLDFKIEAGKAINLIEGLGLKIKIVRGETNHGGIVTTKFFGRKVGYFLMRVNQLCEALAKIVILRNSPT
jgi:hypothetical protein